MTFAEDGLICTSERDVEAELENWRKNANERINERTRRDEKAAMGQRGYVIRECEK